MSQLEPQGRSPVDWDDRQYLQHPIDGLASPPRRNQQPQQQNHHQHHPPYSQQQQPPPPPLLISQPRQSPEIHHQQFYQSSPPQPLQPPPQPPQHRLPRQRPHDLDLGDLSLSPRVGTPPHLSRTPTAPAPLPSPFSTAPGPGLALRSARPPLSPLGPPTSAPTSPRFTNFDGFARSPILEPILEPRPSHTPIEPRSPTQPRSPAEKLDELIATEASYYHSDSSAPPSPGGKALRHGNTKEKALAVPPLSIRPKPDAGATISPHDRIARPENDRKLSQAVGPPVVPPLSPVMSGTKTAVAVRAVAPVSTKPHAAPRKSSMDSAVTALASRVQPVGQKGADNQPLDVAHLVRTAGSPEAAIQYLIKERQSQSQQNSQLWRLVDKQRAMILGLNKDLERALKDKERYRKKLKEMMAASADPGRLPRLVTGGLGIPRLGLTVPNGLDVDSPNVDPIDSARLSPIDVSLAPYPITPPADRPSVPLLNPVAELLEGRADMPEPRDHAYDGYDHEAREREADLRRRQIRDEQIQELVANFPAAPSATSPRASPSGPPKMPPPELPPPSPLSRTAHPVPPSLSLAETTSKTDSIAQFPSPPGRKPPPAPLQLDKDDRDKDDKDSDLDGILTVVTITDTTEAEEKRGRRRTREEDDHDRQMTALKEAEARSLSKRSKNSQPVSPASMVAQASPVARPAMPEPLASMLSPERSSGPLKSPGLPSSPRAGLFSGAIPPPLSPRTITNRLPPGPPPSPRPPRQPIPQHPAASVPGPPPPPKLAPLGPPPPIPAAGADFESLPSPKSLHGARKRMEIPASPARVGEAATDEPGVFKGFVTEEHPDLLLPPNALPAVQVRVASSRMKPSRASLISLTQLEEDPVFTLAITRRSDAHELWRVEKDSASLLRLDQKMKQCSNFTAKAPERSLFSGHAPAKLDARRLALDHYLEALLNTQLDVLSALELCRYLSTNTLSPNEDGSGGGGGGGSSISSSSRVQTTDARSESAAAGPGGGRRTRSGYLTKRGKNFGGWKARYFVLDGPQLQYYETPGGPQLGRIKLKNAQIGKQSSHAAQNETSSSQYQQQQQQQAPDEFDNQYRHAFLIMEPKKKDSSSHVKHVLCAESDEERDQWVEALLQWTDYKSSDDDDEPQPQPPKNLQEKGRRASAADQDRRANMTRRRATKSMHIAESDGLIGVSYDSTQAGAAPPQGQGPANAHRRRASVGLPDNPTSGFLAPAGHDEAPDAALWANKMVSMGLAPPHTDDKKHKKRSFFGFGPKPRSASTDARDSMVLSGDGGGGGGGGAMTLVGSTGATGSTPPPQHGYHGPVKPAFGATLGEAVRWAPPSDVRVPLPAVVFRCIQFLDAKRGVYEEGIFRVSGSNAVIRALRERFNVEGDVNLLTDGTVYDIHAVASLLKMYLRELPTTILTHDLHNQFVEVSKLSEPRDRIAGYAELARRLPQANGTLLKYLVSFLIKIINHQDANKMSVRNVGIVFSPTLNIPNPVFAALLQNYQAIFGIAPEDYQLPILGSDDPGSLAAPTTVAPAGSAPTATTSKTTTTTTTTTTTVGPAPPPLRHGPFDNSPVRPATAGTGASPSRQRLIEAMERDHGHSQSHIVLNMHPSRGSPSPPASLASVGSGPRQGQGYEPHYLHQQPQGGTGRPSHDSSGSSHDGHHPVPAYEQAVHGMNSMGNVNGVSNASRRRESAVLMGAPMGLNPQGSRSRLREETRF